MFLIDTDVISELSKPLPSPAVLNWFAATPAQHIHISSVTLCETEFGLAFMPAGKRKDALLSATRKLVHIDFEGRCLNLDVHCAAAYGQLAAKQQHIGRTCSTADAMIAAIALPHKFVLVTRDTKDFESIAGLRVIDPLATLAV